MLRKIKKIIAACFIIIILFQCNMTTVVNAEGIKGNTTVNVRVAYYPLDGFFEYDENGKECGYGVDYLNELTKYANINWIYIPVKSWEDIGPMISADEVDVRMPVSEPSQPSEKYSYTTEEVISSYHAIMTSKVREDLFYKDYDTIKTLKIALAKGLEDKTGFDDYYSAIGLTENNLIYYDDYNQCKNALDRGEVDALISNIMDLTDDMKILDKFAAIKNYITTRKGSLYYSVINSAMTQLELENPSFQVDLYEKYFPERAQEPYTKEETDYMNRTESLKVAVFENRKPVSYYDEQRGEFRGIGIDIANDLSNKIGIRFDYVPVTTEKPGDMLKVTDLLMPYSKSDNDEDYFVTSKLLNTEVLFAVKSGVVEPEAGSRIGVLDSTPGIANIVIARGEFDIVTYKSCKEALRALQKGEIDGFANSSYVLNWELENPRYDDLTILHYQSIPLDYDLCGKSEDAVLQSILNKGIASISEAERERIIKADTSFTIDDFSIEDQLYIYRQIIMMGCMVLIVVIVAAIILSRKRANYIRKIEEQTFAAELANKEKSNFLSRMSHDMRTPMNGILGLSYLMEKEQNIDTIKGYIPKLQEASAYLLQLINDVLDVNKIESGNLTLHPKVCDEEKLFDSIIDLMRPLMNEKEIEFHFKKIDIEWQFMLLDEQRVKQIFVNLLSNAIKFTPQGGRIDFVMELVSQTDDMIRDKFIVRDSGIGISKEFLPHIFEPFKQEERQEGENKGTGLGLPIVKQLVELMGGIITVESEENTGTEITLFLNFPLTNAPEEKTGKQEREDVSDNKKLQKQCLHILLCEDHPLNAMIAIKLLEQENAEVIWVKNGKEGVETFGKSAIDEFDLVLMDIRMPVMDGLEATREIRQMDREDAAGIPIIAMSANAYEEDVEQSLNAGMNMHLAKPIEPKKMYEAINQVLMKNS